MVTYYRKLIHDNNSEWIECGGGNCPTKAKVIVKFRHNLIAEGNYPYNSYWKHMGVCSDIIAYRIIKE